MKTKTPLLSGVFFKLLPTRIKIYRNDGANKKRTAYILGRRLGVLLNGGERLTCFLCYRKPPKVGKEKTAVLKAAVTPVKATVQTVARSAESPDAATQDPALTLTTEQQTTWNDTWGKEDRNKHVTAAVKTTE